jgi:hypothetical protein
VKTKLIFRVNSVTSAEILAGRAAVIVRAIDAEAETFWQSRGFIPARDNPSVLMRSIDDMRAWLSDL